MHKKILLTTVLISGLVLIADHFINNYLFFHVLSEFFSVCILITLFTITWNVRKHLTNWYLLFVGLGGLFIGILDLLHTITFQGMNIIHSDIYFANQFWIATRFFESLILLTGLILVSRKIHISANTLLIIYSIITISIILSILVLKIFPICYIANQGQTPFKIHSEYVIIGILAVAFIVLLRSSHFFEKDIHELLLWSIGFAIISEICFTLYTGNFDYINKLGHVFKILSFFMVFKANIQHGFSQPMETFFLDRKINEEKIKRYNVELQKQVDTKNRLFSILAHDLRNPFTVLLGYTDLLLDPDNNFSKNDQQNILKTINETCQEAFRLLENLLAWSRTQTSDIAFNPVEFDIREVLDECLLLISKQALLKDIAIVKDYSSSIVIADKDMVMTVVRNLMSNAVKFTPRNGRIIVRSGSVNNTVKISIQDNGVGIPEDRMNSLFHVNINHSTRGTENESGIGLGLIIAKEFIRINTGELQVESRPAEGSVFSFTLPLVTDNQLPK